MPATDSPVDSSSCTIPSGKEPHAPIIIPGIDAAEASSPSTMIMPRVSHQWSLTRAFEAENAPVMVLSPNNAIAVTKAK